MPGIREIQGAVLGRLPYYLVWQLSIALLSFLFFLIAFGSFDYRIYYCLLQLFLLYYCLAVVFSIFSIIVLQLFLLSLTLFFYLLSFYCYNIL